MADQDNEMKRKTLTRWPKRATTFADCAPDSDMVERRDYVSGGYSSGASGRSTIGITCPFCGAYFRAYIWSLCGGGKRCPDKRCGAIFGSIGQAARLKCD
jgi:hypothetical protein